MKTLILFLIVSITAIAQMKVDASFQLSIGFTDTITASVGRVDTLVNNATAGVKGLFKRKITGTRVTTSLVDTIQNYWGVSILADDTLEVSTTATFPTIESIVVLPNIPVNLGPYSQLVKTNLYIRPRAVSGATGTARYYLYLWGW